MYTITKKEFENIQNDYKGEYMNYWGDHPEWEGKKVVVSYFVTHDASKKCSLLVEGVHFEIV